MRTIDAAELKKKLEAEHCDCEVIQIIDDMPTAAENVKYGAWAVKNPSRMKWIPDESDDTIRRYLKEHGGFWIEDGRCGRKAANAKSE